MARTRSAGSSRKSTPVNTPTKQKKFQSNPKNKQNEDKSLIPQDRIINAITQLNKFTSSSDDASEDKKSQLLEDDELSKSVNLIAVNATSFSGSSKNFKSKLLTIKNSFYKPWKASSTTSIKDFKTLLILKDSDMKNVTEDDVYDKLNEFGITIDEIVCGKDLKTKYKAFEARRAFISEFSLILADDNIVTTLPKLLGGKAYEKIETTPIPIRCYANKEFSLKALTNSIKKVYLTQLPVKLPRGTTMNVHLGNLEWFKPEELATNIENITESLVKNYKIRAIFIKSNKSPVLPLYYNQDVIDEITVSATEKKTKENEKDFVNIDGVDIHLSNFDKALMEIANPAELGTVFEKQIESVKRKRATLEDSKTKEEEEKNEEKKVEKAPKAKKAKK
ncbi:Cic1p NDAI_0D01560 [Naumovozyma dairenensis CBS 421]|uniref:Proteasome-interacting protein CIC1 n=1 Tax=Naumovozyma dairenensis (strain ATCC 10597 / BCRC 20456 / CBS 421 / NBRC 0211 / NRRL Y-12639) TaxID=1071378 RepID=G0W9K9_NAUDC|nr:hypothetical protein NDAI_0D01560 [Naumovozyma dairenensis CBS 421]CCD24470.1 hypothetical protein NDAI_0D01560 [Naumovozyma dairenensis CBS 421]